MKKKAVLLLNGNPLGASPLPPSVEKLTVFLRSLPDNELLTKHELSKRSGIPYKTIDTGSRLQSEALVKFRALIRYPRPILVWGNAKTIAELLKNKELLA